MSDGLNVGRLAELGGCGRVLGVEEVSGEESVHKSRLAEAGGTSDKDVELETALEGLAVDLLRDRIKTDLATEGSLFY